MLSFFILPMREAHGEGDRAMRGGGAVRRSRAERRKKNLYFRAAVIAAWMSSIRAPEITVSPTTKAGVPSTPRLRASA